MEKSVPLKQEDRGKKVNEDIISSLPDAILCHIISFLPTKNSVGTGILSRRWRFIWTSVPYLDFDDFARLENSYKFDIFYRRAQFKKFVETVLILHNYPCIKRFLLNLGDSYFAPKINRWVCSAILHDIEELDLRIFKFNFKLPEILFSCRSIRILKLNYGISFKILESVNVCLPNLKILNLVSVESLHEAAIAKLLSGSPVLEELLIDRHPFDKLRTFCVQSSTLKRLTIRKIKVVDDIDEANNECYKVTIDAPKLEFLEIHDYVSEEYNIAKISSLVKATFDVSQRYVFTKNFKEYVGQLFQLLILISDVKALSLSAHMLEATSCASHDSFRYFHNLSHLEARGSTNGWLMLFKMFRYIPNLRIVIVHQVDSSDSNIIFIRFLPYKGPFLFEKIAFEMKDFDGSELEYFPGDACLQELVPQCFFSSLEIVELHGFQGNTVEMEVVEYFLKYAKVLKTIRITSFAARIYGESNVLKRLLTFPRASSTCQVTIS